jgi:GT2 family glycosyltransferase
LPEQAAAPPTLAVHVVLYRHNVESVTTLLHSVDRSVAYAQDRQSIDSIGPLGPLGPVVVLIGDSSPEPVLSPSQLSSVESSVPRCGPGSVAYHYFGRNRGSAGGNNDLFGCADSDLVLIINPDCYASPSLLFRLRLAMSDPGVGIVEARQVPLEHPKEFDRRTGETSWASGSCMLVRRAVIERIGGFDEDSFFMYCDDVDFSWRARLAGYRVVYQPSACVFHDKRLDVEGQILAGEAEVYYSAEASLMMAWKWSNPQLLEQSRHDLLRSGLDAHRRAVDEFDDRRANGRLPPRLDAEGKVAQFVGANYAVHRFAYSD